MTKEDFAREIQRWKQELTDEVLAHYRKGHTERGKLAFARWKERLAAFLRQQAPGEAERLDREMTHYGSVLIHGEHPYDTFMREDGDRTLAFLDDLAESALKGRIPGLADESVGAVRVLRNSPKVFLSYAREDMATAKKLFNQLRESGAGVWFDREALLPGQKWRAAIGKAIRESRFFLALLSSESVNKKGFVQREVKQALELLDEYPDHEIYLIPARLDDCAIMDERLRSLQWVDMFPDWDDGLARLLKALDAQG
jgi:hypothetical protein